MRYKTIFCTIIGFSAGLINSLFGLGGGIIVTPFLFKLNFSVKKSHANSLFVTLLLSITSLIIFSINGYTKIIEPRCWAIIFWGIMGSLIGSFSLKKIRQNLLRKLFACFCIWAGFQLIF